MSLLPPIGLGTSGNRDPDQCAESVATAIDLGYEHVDTAQMYDNEAAVGEGVRRAETDADEVIVATKIHPDNLAYDDVHDTFEDSLDRLEMDRVDLLYVHWPRSAYDAEETLAAFDELYDDGLIEHVGVSNFTPDLMDEARDLLDAPISAHQVEMHPLLPQEALVADAENHGHHLVAYCPIGRGEILDQPELVEVAEKHDVTPAQVSLAWLMEHDPVVPIPKATGEEHLRENFAAQEFALDEVDVELIDGIDEERRLIDPDDAAWNR